MGDQLRPCADRGQCGGLDAELEHRREADRPDHPKGVLLESGVRLADGAQDPGVEVEDAAVRVDERGRLARSCAPGHRVDREVPASQVDIDRVAELDAVRSPEVGVVMVGPEGRDLEWRAVAADRHGPELVLIDGAREQLDELLGTGVRREVPVVWTPIEDDITQRPPDDIRGMPRHPERPKQVVDGAGDGSLDRGRRRRIGQLRPRKRYVRHASLCSSRRYGVNIE